MYATNAFVSRDEEGPLLGEERLPKRVRTKELPTTF